MNNSTSKMTFQKIPVNITGSFQSTYLYSKLCMLVNTWYSEKALGTNPISRKTEITRQYISQYVNELYRLGFISITKEKVEGENFYRNIYTINSLVDEYWIPVANDFINNPNIPAVVKGFAIRLACLKDKPTTFKELCDVLDVNFRTAKKYIAILTENGILNGMQLNEEYFPNLKKEAWKKRYEAKFEDLYSYATQPVYNKKGIQIGIVSKAMLNKLNWIKENLEDKVPYKNLYKQLEELESGTWNRTDCKKQFKLDLTL